jgi:hypothetical protein
LFDCCASFGCAESSSASGSSAKRRRNLTPELLTRTFKEALNRGFAAQSVPLRVHVGTCGIFGGRAFDPNDAAIRKLEVKIRHKLLLLLWRISAGAAILKNLAGCRCSRASSSAGFWQGRKLQDAAIFDFGLAAHSGAISIAEGTVHVAAIGGFTVDGSFNKPREILQVLCFRPRIKVSDLEGRDACKSLTLRRIPHIDDDSITVSILTDHGILWANGLYKFAFAQAEALAAIIFFGALGRLPRLKFLLLPFGFRELTEAVHARARSRVGGFKALA